MSVPHWPVLGLSLACSVASAQPVFRTLGFLNPDGSGPSIANAVSADGRIVVGFSNSPDGFQAFRWTVQTGMVGLGAFPNPDGPESQAFAISADGQVIGGGSARPGSLNENGSPFRWTVQTGLAYLGSLGGTEGGYVGGMNSDGSILVGNSSSPDFSYHAFIWTAAGMQQLPPVGDEAQSSTAFITPDGSFIVGTASIGVVGNSRAVVWSRDQGQYAPRVLPLLTPGTLAFGAAATPDGATIVGQSSGRAVRWQSDVPQDLGLIPGGLPSALYFASGVSADGSVIVGLGDLDPNRGTGTAIIWEAQHGMRDLNQVLQTDFGLNLHGFYCFSATSISPDGLVITGYGSGPTGEQEAFVADLHPVAACYPNCDGSTVSPILNVNDFICFQTRFAAGDAYANCDGSTVPPVLNVNDFICFQTRFASGCR